jgi:small subunit ribosomal protein S18
MQTDAAQIQISHIDYKDVETLKRFLNPHGKIMPRRRTGLSSAAQRQLATAVKRARFMALLPYIVR